MRLPDRPRQTYRARLGQFERELALPRANHIFAELLLIRSEDADAPPSPGNSDIPLLVVRGCLHSGIGEEHVINGFPLRAIRSNRVTMKKLPIIRVQSPAILQFNGSI